MKQDLVYLICQHKSIILYLFIITLSLILGAYLRFYRLSEIPVELFSDEAMTYVSAKSVIQTGKDIFGKNIIFFSDRLELRPPVYGYLAFLSSRIFGQNTFGLRFPAALMGTLNILTVGLIAFLITNKLVTFPISSFIYALIPWSVHFSKSGYEPPAFLFFFLLAILLFLISFKIGNNKILFFSAIIFGLSLYTYSSVLFWISLYLPILLYIEKRLSPKFLKNKNLIIFCLIILLFCIPYFYLIATQPSLLARPKSISTFKNGLNAKSVHIFITNYFTHYSPSFLFIKGDPNLRHSVGIGELYPIMAPFLLIGLGYVLFTFKKQPMLIIILLGLTSYPLGGSLTNDGVPHATRTLLGSFWLTLTCALGIWFVLEMAIKNKGFAKLLIYLAMPTSLIIGVYLTFELTQTYDKYRINSATWWEYGNKAVFSQITPLARLAPSICLGNLNYWNSQALIAYYLPQYKYKIYETWDDSACQKSGSIIVLPAIQSISKTYQKIGIIYGLNREKLYYLIKIY